MTTWNHNNQDGGRTFVTFNNRQYVSRGETVREPTKNTTISAYNSNDRRTRLDLSEVNSWLDRVEQLPDE